jgi:transcriptional regulator with XRE-family HTH domain
MNSIALRIKQLIDEKKLNISSFERKIGVGNNSIGTIINKNSNVSGAILSKILNSYNDVNANWLITGKGEMLTSYQSNEEIDKVEEPKTNYLTKEKEVNNYNILYKNYMLLKEQTQLQEELNAMLKEKLQLTEEKLQQCENEKKLH